MQGFFQQTKCRQNFELKFQAKAVSVTQGHSRIPGGGVSIEVCRSGSGRGFHNRAGTIGFRDEVRPGI